MEQIKKQSFALYPMLTDKLIKAVRQQLPSKERKGLGDQQVLADFVRRNPELQNDHTFYIMAEELHLKKLGSQVIFPESSQVLDNLLKARFSLESSQGFDLPFPAFILAPPRGYAYAGTAIPSLLVTWVAGDQFKNEVLKPFLEHIKVDEKKVGFSELPVEGVLTLVYPDSTGERSRTIIYGQNIAALLSAKTPKDYVNAMISEGLITSESDISDSDRDIQFYCLRLIAALGVYHVATRGTKLKPGFPGAQAPKMEGRRPEQQVSPITLINSSPPSDRTERDHETSPHYRSWHFRQLRDGRYYRGEFEKYSPGTRYIFVESALVKSDATPNTQS
ncbi:hypothetical protein [Pseudomonas amygdali]|uniref:Uncharacterized protein n=2 Tax=Pseudomonas amygdali pv. lachrymans TaxID=53707 RepID=A0ABR5KSF0_PSEAV|nr:hypothetical protein [Pseudomonas amygdali]AXH60228.1 hypothetical protein PLA107_034135 [Pseudomonas amygdali pv. lachrymans str. M301315]KPC17627.1 Uncharacterized protein AC499_0829 [Pseudomonas amygdali pv. lachrymans]